MKKVKYAKSLVIASFVFSLASVLFGIYHLINNDYLGGLGLIFVGVAISWNDWSNLFKKKK